MVEALSQPTQESLISQELTRPQQNALIALDSARRFLNGVNNGTGRNQEERLHTAQSIHDKAVERVLKGNPELLAKAQKAFKDKGAEGYHDFLDKMEGEAKGVKEVRKVSLDVLNGQDLQDISHRADHLRRKDAINFLLRRKTALDIASNAEKDPKQEQKNIQIKDLLLQDPDVMGIAMLLQTAAAEASANPKDPQAQKKLQMLKPLAKPVLRNAMERMIDNRIAQARDQQALKNKELQQIAGEVDKALPPLDEARVTKVIQELPKVDTGDIVQIGDPKLKEPVSPEATQLRELQQNYDAAFDAVQKNPTDKRAKRRLGAASRKIYKMMILDADQDSIAALYKRHLRAAFLESFNPANLPPEAVKEGKIPAEYSQPSIRQGIPDYAKQGPIWEEKVFVDNAKGKHPRNIFDNKDFRDIYSMYYHGVNKKPEEAGLTLEQHKMILGMDPLLAKYNEAQGLAINGREDIPENTQAKLHRGEVALDAYQNIMDIILHDGQEQLFPDKAVLQRYEAALQEANAKLPKALDTLDPQLQESLVKQLRQRINFGTPEVWDANKAVFEAAMKRYQELRAQVSGQAVPVQPEATEPNERVSVMGIANKILEDDKAAKEPDSSSRPKGQEAATDSVEQVVPISRTDTKEPEKKVEDPKAVIDRLKKWVGERGLVQWQNGPMILVGAKGEWQARRQIKNAAVDDLGQPLQPAAYEQEVEFPTMDARHAIDAALHDSGKTEVSFDHTDSVTKESYTKRFRKEGDTYIAEEVRSNGSIISQAKIGPKGKTTLTLNYTGPRYEGRNPDIQEATTYPRATAKVFNLLSQELIASLSKGKIPPGMQPAVGQSVHTEQLAQSDTVPSVITDEGKESIADGSAVSTVSSEDSVEDTSGSGEAGLPDSAHEPQADRMEAQIAGNVEDLQSNAEMLGNRAQEAAEDLLKKINTFTQESDNYEGNIEPVIRVLTATAEHEIFYRAFTDAAEQVAQEVRQDIGRLQQFDIPTQGISEAVRDALQALVNAKEISEIDYFKQQAIAKLSPLIERATENRSSKSVIRDDIQEIAQGVRNQWGDKGSRGIQAAQGQSAAKLEDMMQAAIIFNAKVDGFTSEIDLQESVLLEGATKDLEEFRRLVWQIVAAKEDQLRMQQHLVQAQAKKGLQGQASLDGQPGNERAEQLSDQEVWSAWINILVAEKRGNWKAAAQLLQKAPGWEDLRTLLQKSDVAALRQFKFDVTSEETKQGEIDKELERLLNVYKLAVQPNQTITPDMQKDIVKIGRVIDEYQRIALEEKKRQESLAQNASTS